MVERTLTEQCFWQCWHCLTVNPWGPIEAGPPDAAGVSITTHPVIRTCTKCGHPWRTRCKGTRVRGPCLCIKGGIDAKV